MLLSAFMEQRLDIPVNCADNSFVTQSVEQIVKAFGKAVAASRADRSPAKARAFLLRAGIAEKNNKSPNGIKLAKRFR